MNADGSFIPAKRIRVYAFGSGDPLQAFSNMPQGQYLRRYLGDLQAEAVVEEPNYFDHDYLAEFSSFYSLGARGFPNICRRLHFFSCRVDRRALKRFLSGAARAKHGMQEHYLGFVVIRPIPWAPFGRTVLRWYAESTPSTPRIMQPSREYTVHLAGAPLTVTGLAWQQQDTGVGACATVALWTALQSSAFDPYHAVPTTAEVTRAAHRTASLGARIFPSNGLTIAQLCEAVKEQGLAPVVSDGDLTLSDGKAFRRERFATVLASLVRSGYPVVLLAKLDGQTGGHAVCVVGFRETAPQPQGAEVAFQDAATSVIYLHDDNIGPNVRMCIEEDAATGAVVLRAEAPAPVHASQWPDPTLNYWRLRPSALVCAVHDDLRSSPDTLHGLALEMATSMCRLWRGATGFQVELVVSLGFRRIAHYAGDVLARSLSGDPDALAETRLRLQETVPPMSLHVGVVRIGLAGGQPLLDVLFDTTEGDRHRAFCHVAFMPGIGNLIDALEQMTALRFGHRVLAA